MVDAVVEDVARKEKEAVGSLIVEGYHWQKTP
jgi:hypothetical protein